MLEVKTKHFTVPCVDRGIDQVDAADEVVLVIEPSDEVTQPFCSVRRQVEDVFELVFLKKAVHQVHIVDASFHESGAGMHVVSETTREVVEGNYRMSSSNQMICHVRANEACSTGDKNF